MGSDDYSIELGRQAASYFERQSADQKRRIVEKLREACADVAGKSKRLVNRGGQRRIRVGNLRILFDVDEKGRRLLVTAMLPRGDVYKHGRSK